MNTACKPITPCAQYYNRGRGKELQLASLFSLAAFDLLTLQVKAVSVMFLRENFL